MQRLARILGSQIMGNAATHNKYHAALMLMHFRSANNAVPVLLHCNVGRSETPAIPYLAHTRNLIKSLDDPPGLGHPVGPTCP